MKPEQRRLALGGLITIALSCVAAGIVISLYCIIKGFDVTILVAITTAWLGVVSTVVLGIVAVLEKTTGEVKYQGGPGDPTGSPEEDAGGPFLSV